ncbi:helix-turn-helix transcriptional regulator [Actinocorallia longicatena]|uniref:Helix-turn-helix transcriptional regulator n=1 Tax=Actinocorallia longicatena TaxID=111803 RepID=A0ABP6QCE7_9ACTN
MSVESRSTTRRRYIARYLRDLRDSKRYTLEAAGRLLDRSPSSLSMIENARQGVRPRDLEHILRRYGVPIDGPDARGLIELTRQDTRSGWWAVYGDLMTPEALDLCSLEANTGSFRHLAVDSVPGLAQTEDYAAAMIMNQMGDIDGAIGRRYVEFRMERQQVLHGPHRPDLHFIIDESGLRRAPAGDRVMRVQLERLLQLSEHPGTTIQVRPYESLVLIGPPYSILQLARTNITLILVEQLFNRWVVDDQPKARQYQEAFTRASALLPTPAESRDIIHRIASAL